MLNQSVTINSRKFDRNIHKTWRAELVEETDEMLIFVGVFNKKIIHPQLGIIRRGTVSYEYYWKTKWFNIFRFHEPEGQLRNYYCNINMPPKFENNVLDYIDLDIDLLVWKDLRYEILDLDDYLENDLKYKYPPEIPKMVLTGLYELLELLKTGAFPFDLLNT